MEAVSSVACERVRDSLLGSPLAVVTGRLTFSTLVRGANNPHFGGHWKYLYWEGTEAHSELTMSQGKEVENDLRLVPGHGTMQHDLN